MVQLHIILCCILIGFSGVDLCFDSLILFQPYTCSFNYFIQIQNYYKRTRSTYIVQFITLSIILLAISLIRCLIYRHNYKDIISFILFILFVPYYIFIMEPAEDSCINNENNNLSEYEIRDGLFKVGIGHVIIIIIASIVVLLDLEWKIESSTNTTNNTKTKKEK